LFIGRSNPPERRGSKTLWHLVFEILQQVRKEKGLTPLGRRAKVDRPLRRAMLTIAPPSGGHDLSAGAMEEDFLSCEELRS
jgi:hypothetical protein